MNNINCSRCNTSFIANIGVGNVMTCPNCYHIGITNTPRTHYQNLLQQQEAIHIAHQMMQPQIKLAYVPTNAYIFAPTSHIIHNGNIIFFN